MKRFFVGLLFAGVLSAAPGGGSVSVGPLLGANLSTGPNGPTISAPMQIVILLTLLALLPAVIMCITPFLRISIVLHFLAPGARHPDRAFQSGVDRLGSLFVDAGDAARCQRHLRERLGALRQRQTIAMDDALSKGEQPLRHFLLKFAREKDIQLFVEHLPRASTAHAAGSGSEDSDSGLHHYRSSRPLFRSAPSCFCRSW